ncbi:hypothetical protein GGQ71_002724 [Rhizobium taibaishanense]|uniref:Uncharacterized protein n=1 Tax=Allorhizobium taibaishanense TaxID=887144 RepID=A0A7W6HND5_9HYPH|nr:hypothetical protein [Allorhizobium taibaishanense]
MPHYGLMGKPTLLRVSFPIDAKATVYQTRS